MENEGDPETGYWGIWADMDEAGNFLISEF